MEMEGSGREKSEKFPTLTRVDTACDCVSLDHFLLSCNQDLLSS